VPLKLTRRPRSPNWIIRGTLRGIRIEESTGVSEKRAAEEIRAKREAELLAQSIYGRRAVVSFAEAAVSYLESGGSTRFVEPIVQYFGTTPLAQIVQAVRARVARSSRGHVRGHAADRRRRLEGQGHGGRKAEGPSSTSDFDIWIGRSASILNGRPPFS